MKSRWGRSSLPFITVLTLSCAGCGTDTPQQPARIHSWPSTAESAAVFLETRHLTCHAEGRELYPVYYECRTPDGSAVYLYADDHNRLVAVRAFLYPGEDRLAHTALDLAFGRSIPDDAVLVVKQDSGYVVVGNIVVENVRNDSLRILRLTPLQFIHSENIRASTKSGK